VPKPFVNAVRALSLLAPTLQGCVNGSIPSTLKPRALCGKTKGWQSHSSPQTQVP
jgi:hypothetical protein